MTIERFRRGYAMKRVTIDLKNCYGIKSLKKEFDFTSARVYAIYAPNGVMKSSLAQTFQDAATKQKSADRIFPQRESTRRITDETGKEIEGENRILVVLPYNDGIGPTERTSTLLIDPKLKDEYIQLHIKTRTAKQAFLGAIAKQAYSPKIGILVVLPYNDGIGPSSRRLWPS
jgi:hypothetical protein